MSETVKVGGIYRHYNGAMYEVISVAKMESNSETMVVYRPFLKPDCDPVTWIRPVSEFMEQVEHEGVNVARFLLLTHTEESIKAKHAEAEKLSALRDQFAGLAAAMSFASDMSYEKVARYAYSQADALIAARVQNEAQ